MYHWAGAGGEIFRSTHRTHECSPCGPSFHTKRAAVCSVL